MSLRLYAFNIHFTFNFQDTNRDPRPPPLNAAPAQAEGAIIWRVSANSYFHFFYKHQTTVVLAAKEAKVSAC
jgi:hypothetical protein